MPWHSYYGNGYTAQSWPDSYREDNVKMIVPVFRQAGWTDFAIAALCGNMQVESYINPGQFEHSFPTGTATGGYGLVQWTPRTKYSVWAGSDWDSNWDKQPQRILWELENGEQWITKPAYPISFYEWTREDGTNYDVRWLARAFFENYERGSALGNREAYAERWLQFIQGIPAGPKIPVWLLFKIRWRNGG